MLLVDTYRPFHHTHSPDALFGHSQVPEDGRREAPGRPIGLTV